MGLAFLVLLVGGASATGTGSSITAIQSAPADNSWDGDLTVPFQCSVTALNSTIANVSLWIDGKLNWTNDTFTTSANLTLVYNFTTVFTADSCTGRDWSCVAYNNESINASATENRSISTNWTIKLDATDPTVSCDRGTDYFNVERGDLIYFTSADNCGIASRSWTKDGGTTTSSIFVNTDDIDTAIWERNAYSVTETVTDSGGNTATATCSIAAMSKRTPGQRIVIPAGATLTAEDGQLTVGEEEDDDLAKSAPIVFLVLLLGFLLLKPGKSPRKKGRKR